MGSRGAEFRSQEQKQQQEQHQGKEVTPLGHVLYICLWPLMLSRKSEDRRVTYFFPFLALSSTFGDIRPYLDVFLPERSRDVHMRV